VTTLGPEPYDPLPDLIERAEHRTDGIGQLKQIAALALDWHAPRMTLVTDAVSKDPATGELLWAPSMACACGAGEYPCDKRRQIAAILGAAEWVR
jgi:hypothetical protein